MRIKQENVDFRISRRVLWVGLKAYPLSHVTRVQAIEADPPRARMLREYGRRGGATAGLGVVLLFGLSCMGQAVPPSAIGWSLAAVTVVLAVQTGFLVRDLLRPTLHILSIATSGTARAALVSTDQKLIHDLMHRVVEAIDNPAAEFQIQVENLVYGDMYGGDRVEGDKTVFEGS